MLIDRRALRAPLRVNHFTLRLPIIIFAAFAIGLVFLWGAEAAGIQAASVPHCSRSAITSPHALHALHDRWPARRLHGCGSLLSLRRPVAPITRHALGLRRGRRRAILTKGIAGIFPLAILGLYWIAAPPKYRPGFRRVALAAGLSIALAARGFSTNSPCIRAGSGPSTSPWRFRLRGRHTAADLARESRVLLSHAARRHDTVLFARFLVSIPAFVRALTPSIRWTHAARLLVDPDSCGHAVLAVSQRILFVAADSSDGIDGRCYGTLRRRSILDMDAGISSGRHHAEVGRSREPMGPQVSRGHESSRLRRRSRSIANHAGLTH